MLFSAHSGRIYIGYTTDLVNRIKSHNIYSKKGYTTRFRPWTVVHVEVFRSKSDALKREKFLKSGIGRKWIHAELLPSISL
ncbi:MAG TPA: GIY-YIG nuclease family protein [Bacteroidia bacterium]|nr:GIY-YIG nuclease family protein [Bacteroidia bacterium]